MNKLRRNFVGNIAGLLTIGFINPIVAIASPKSNEFSKLSNIEKNQKRLGKWVSSQLSLHAKADLVNSNSVFLSNLNILSNEQIERSISADFKMGNTVKINGLLLSSKESALLLLSVDKKLQTKYRRS